MAKDSKITLRFTEEEFRALDDKRHQLGTKFQTIGERLFLDWLAEGAPKLRPVESPDPREARLIRLLRVIMRSGSRYQEAIEHNLAMLAFAVVVGKDFTHDDIQRTLEDLLIDEEVSEKSEAEKPTGTE